MKRTLLIGMLLTSVSAFAFMGHQGPNRAMFDELNLTAAQEKQIKTIRKESRDERIKLMDQMDDLRDQSRKRMMSALDDEQKVKFKALRKEMRQSRKNDRCDRDTMLRMKPNCDR
ncbi:MAG: Spy/CpxP family protein refolding chaperone [Sulfurimonadaceae bacterium]